jgi:hypothetical protein
MKKISTKDYSKLFKNWDKKRNPDDYDQKQLQKGLKVEMEHTDNKEIAQNIAMDHLDESNDKKGEKGGKYYELLEEVEKKIKKKIGKK